MNIGKLQVVLVLTILITGLTAARTQTAEQPPLRMAIAGLSHGHAAFILGRKNKDDFKLVGIFETNRKLVRTLYKQYNFDTTLVYSDLGKMLEHTKPQAVVAFGSVYDHLAVVRACAPAGIHVMVEKPLATDESAALQMEAYAKKNHILLLTDYETSWYPTSLKSFQLVNDSNYVGKINKVVIHDGHQGPQEIGCSPEFMEWLTDPVLNGGGALMDFGCYGANLMTYLMKGQHPVSVTAVTQHLKPEIYPRVEDDATIIVKYSNAECIIQASWNWPFGRKDMEIYGDKGYIITLNNEDLRLRNNTRLAETMHHYTSKDVNVYEDPFSYFAAVVLGKVKQSDYDPYSLENNLTAMKILEAAKKSAATGQTIFLKD